MARHVPATRELHLGRRDYLLHANSVKDSLNALPGFRTSAAFFTFLRANLVLSPNAYAHSAMSSNTSTPLLTPSASQTLPPPSPSPLSASEPATNGPELSSIPPLTTAILTEAGDRIEALKLVADSVAQQRQAASTAVIFHPIFGAIWVLLVALVFQLLYHDSSDTGIVICTAGGVTMTLLVLVRGVTGGYIAQAEKVTWAFMSNPETGEDDLLIGSKFGRDIIGALVLRLERPGGGGSGSARKKAKAPKTSKGKGLIRAWTTGLKYRHKGVGAELLEEAVKVTRDRLGKDAEIGFAVDHVNSNMILPSIFNAGFKKRERMAIKMLEEVDEAGKRKR